MLTASETAGVTAASFLPAHLWSDLVVVFAFGVVAIVVVTLGTLLFDFIYRKVCFQTEIAKGNMSAAVVLAAVILGLCGVMAFGIKAIAGGG